jgi:precorrin-2/cobalt-factor-2 C20-methyltransferase
MSVRANRLIRAATDVAYFRKKGRPGHARQIVEGLLAPDVREHPMEYPVTTELAFDSFAYNDLLARFYAEWSERLALMARSKDVVVLCEGDPFFYGSFMHLYVRLKDRAEVDVVAGISGMAGCWTAVGIPMTWGDDVLTVLMGTLPEAVLVERMKGSDALVVMKTGRNLSKVRRALALAGRLDAAWLVECGTMPEQRIVRLAEVDETASPYFAIVLIQGQGRRWELNA